MGYRQNLTVTAPPGSKAGALVSSVGAAWADKVATDFAVLDGATLAATDRFGQLVLKNTHGTQDLFILLRANAAEATSAAHKLAAGEAFTYDLAGVNGGAGTLTISLQGSGAATTFVAYATFVAVP